MENRTQGQFIFRYKNGDYALIKLSYGKQGEVIREEIPMKQLGSEKLHGSMTEDIEQDLVFKGYANFIHNDTNFQKDDMAQKRGLKHSVNQEFNQ